MRKASEVMKRIVPWACVVGLAILPVVGCSDTSGSENTGGTPGSGGTGGTGGTGGMAGDGGTGGMPQPPVTLFLTLVDEEGSPLEGASFCEGTTSDNCSTTNDEGKATIDVEVPTDGRIIYTYRKTGYLPVLRTDVVDDAFTGNYSHFTVSDATVKAWHEDLDTPYPYEGTGAVVVSVGDIAGVTYELVPASDKPFYNLEDGTPSLTPKATTTDGQGGFHEIAPGVVEVRLMGPIDNCAATAGWPGSVPNSVEMPVLEGFLSWSFTLCEAQ